MSRTNRRGRPPHDNLLTPAERPVVHAVEHGLTNRQIASVAASVPAPPSFTPRMPSRNSDWIIAQRCVNRSARLSEALLREGRTPCIHNSSLDPSARDQDRSRKSRARRLGTATFSVCRIYTFGKFALFACGGMRLFLTEEAPEPSGESILYLLVTDIKGAHDELNARGIDFTSAPLIVHKHPRWNRGMDGVFQGPRGTAVGNHGASEAGCVGAQRASSRHWRRDALERVTHDHLADNSLQSLRSGFIRDLSYALQQRMGILRRQSLAQEKSLRVVTIVLLQEHQLWEILDTLRRHVDAQ